MFLSNLIDMCIKPSLFSKYFFSSSLFVLVASAIAPLMQVHAAEPIKLSAHMNAWDAIVDASPIVQLILIGLVIMSVICWAIIIQKRKQFADYAKANAAFSNLFWKASSLDEVFSKLADHQRSPLAQVFRSAFLELQRIADASKVADSKRQISLEEAASPQLSGIENVGRALRKAADTEISVMESRLGFLATTGSTGPFIGLFGTVWGIMNAFQKIGSTGQASLAVVAPGISEALIATAIGLAAAIPAVVGYNHFLSKIKREELEISNFSADLLNIAKRNFFRKD